MITSDPLPLQASPRRARSLHRSPLGLLLALAGSACHRGSTFTEVRSAEGGFHVQMPGTPEASVQTPAAALGVVKVHVWLVDRHAAGQFQVSYSDLPSIGAEGEIPAATARPLLELECRTPFAGSKFQPEAPRSFVLGSHHALAITGRAPVSPTLPDGGWEEDRCVLVGRRLFHLIAVGPDTGATRRDARTFLDSFAIDPPAGR